MDAHLIIAEEAEIMRSEFDEKVNALKKARSAWQKLMLRNGSGNTLKTKQQNSNNKDCRANNTAVFF